MKVSAIQSYNLRFNAAKREAVDKNFMYIKKDEQQKSPAAFRYHPMDYIGGILAAIVAVLCLSAFRGRLN